MIDRLIDENGKDITDFDVKGELCVRGPTVINGYYNNPKANAESYDEEGYFKTGDILYCDSKRKKWYIVDRKKVCICHYGNIVVKTDNIFSLGTNQSSWISSRTTRT